MVHYFLLMNWWVVVYGLLDSLLFIYLKVLLLLWCLWKLQYIREVWYNGLLRKILWFKNRVLSWSLYNRLRLYSRYLFMLILHGNELLEINHHLLIHDYLILYSLCRLLHIRNWCIYEAIILVSYMILLYGRNNIRLNFDLIKIRIMWNLLLLLIHLIKQLPHYFKLILHIFWCILNSTHCVLILSTWACATFILFSCYLTANVATPWGHNSTTCLCYSTTHLAIWSQNLFHFLIVGLFIQKLNKINICIFHLF